MENASNALMIAGGILITIIVVGLMLLTYNNMVQYPAQEIESQKIEQLKKFNAEYESYDKKKMYGADVVTIINKAVDNNKRNDANEGINDIDVEITLKSDIKATAQIYGVNPDGTIYNTVKEDGVIKEGNTPYSLGVILEGGKTYRLLSTNSEIEKLITGFETKKINMDPEKPEFKYTIVSSGFGDFKRKYFECTGIEYNSETSRVNKLKFVEIDNKKADR